MLREKCIKTFLNEGNLILFMLHFVHFRFKNFKKNAVKYLNKKERKNINEKGIKKKNS